MYLLCAVALIFLSFSSLTVLLFVCSHIIPSCSHSFVCVQSIAQHLPGSRRNTTSWQFFIHIWRRALHSPRVRRGRCPRRARTYLPYAGALLTRDASAVQMILMIRCGANKSNQEIHNALTRQTINGFTVTVNGKRWR